MNQRDLEIVCPRDDRHRAGLRRDPTVAGPVEVECGDCHRVTPHVNPQAVRNAFYGRRERIEVKSS